eukprot:11481374-Alexandrium_andersonii.AAC.1
MHERSSVQGPCAKGKRAPQMIHTGQPSHHDSGGIRNTSNLHTFTPTGCSDGRWVFQWLSSSPLLETQKSLQAFRNLNCTTQERPPKLQMGALFAAASRK